MQPFQDNEPVNPSMHNQCNQYYKTNDNIFSSAWLKEIVQVFRIPRDSHTRVKSLIYQTLYNDKLIIVMNNLPAISKLITLGSLMANPVTYLRIQIGSGETMGQRLELKSSNDNRKVPVYGLSVVAEVETTDLIKHNPTTQSAMQLSEKAYMTLSELVAAILAG